jgi:hypothetical protein
MRIIIYLGNSVLCALDRDIINFLYYFAFLRYLIAINTSPAYLFIYSRFSAARFHLRMEITYNPSIDDWISVKSVLNSKDERKGDASLYG